MINFSFTQLIYIIAVDRTRNFGKAAKECNVSQPSLSMQIQKFEQELDTVIFDRTKNPIVTTDIGKKIIKQAQLILRERNKIPEIVQFSQDEISGEFTIAIIPTISTYLIPRFHSYFKNNFPKVTLKIEEQTTEQIIKNLDQDLIDAGILATPLKQDSLIERHLYYEEFFLYINPQHELYKQNKISAQHLVHHRPWILAEGHCFRNQALNLCSYDYLQSGEINFESGSFETLIRLVDKDKGYTIIPRMTLEYLSKEQKKHVRPFEAPIPSREVSIVHERLFLKEKLIESLEKSIIKTLPDFISTNKKENLQVIDI